MSTYEAGSTASAAIALTRRLTSLKPGGHAVEVDPGTFVRATRLGLNPHSEAAILDSIPVVSADDPSVVAAREQLTAEPTAEAAATGDAVRYEAEWPGREPITIESAIHLDRAPGSVAGAGLHLLMRLRKTLGRQVIAGRGTAGELRGLLHLEGVQRSEHGNLLAFAMSAVMSEAWDEGGIRPDWVAVNVDDSRRLPGQEDRLFVFGAAVIRTRVLPRGIIVSGGCSPLTIRLNVRSLSVWVESPSENRVAPIVAAVVAELDFLRPSAFVVGKFGKAPVLDPQNMPKFDGTPEEWEAFERALRESRGR